ncbi:hypothetical protein O9K51_08162 [Purpureocillium lavendulum]|uniref:Zn(2)-C6 fungal-type domain-containing protein n=1 Tax=Purpureocillium lavendulum TaxID=1247861 RepID=A0AB34FK17_9HYPO|nr:hypothetical protein O9K51_08162 [Purpureocillium lavendulum]
MSSTTSTSPSSTPTPDPVATPCWECQRRHWDCDGTRPVCSRCREAGIVCPGYNDRKPLTWLAPGRVSARPRRSRAGKPQTRAAKPDPVRIKTESVDPPSRPGAEQQSVDCRHGDNVGSTALTSAKPSDCTATDGSQGANVKCLVETRALAVRPRSLEKRDQEQQRNTISTNVPVALRDHMDDVFEATQYFSHQLAPNVFVAPIEGLQLVPASMRHALISLSLGYRILQLSPEQRVDVQPAGVLPFAGSVLNSSPGPVTGAAGKLWWRAHDHVGAAIRLLQHDITHEPSRTTTATIMSVFVLLITEWRSHCLGFTALVALRGGLEGLMQDPEDGIVIRPGLLTYVIMIVMANTTSPSYDQVDPGNHAAMLDTVSDLYSIGMYPRLPCPQQLFLEIVRINDLRSRLAKGLLNPATCGASIAVRDLLRRVMDFSPETWAASQPSTSPTASWLLTARCYQSAVLLFADATVLNPQCVAAPGPKDENRSKYHATRAYHRSLLFKLVSDGLAGQVTKFGIIWPVIIAGFEAAKGTAEERSLVKEGLTDLCRGTAVLFASWTRFRVTALETASMAQATITTERLELRPLAGTHAEIFVELNSEPAVTRFVHSGRPLTRDEALADLAERLAAAEPVPGLGYWLGYDRTTGDAVGWWALTPAPPASTAGDNGATATATFDDETGISQAGAGTGRRAELGYRLLPRHWRKGLAKEGGRALLRHGFTALGLEEVYAETMAVNAASRATMAACGLQYRRTFHVHFDEADAIPGTEEGEVEYVAGREAWLSWVEGQR